jgi:hypothetical protein
MCDVLSVKEEEPRPSPTLEKLALFQIGRKSLHALDIAFGLDLGHFRGYALAALGAMPQITLSSFAPTSGAQQFLSTTVFESLGRSLVRLDLGHCILLVKDLANWATTKGQQVPCPCITT